MSDIAEYSAEWWVNELLSTEKELNKVWRDGGDKIVKRYLDNRGEGDGITDLLSGAAKKYNIFWANTQIMKSALYASAPKPIVKRQHDDAKDDVARTGSMILQRMLTFDLQRQNSDMHKAFEQSTEDRLIPGLGQIWLRLETDTASEEIPPVMLPDEVTGVPIEVVPGFTGEKIVDQRVVTEYVNWKDFLWSPARTWEEVWWVARRVWMKKKPFIKRFGQEMYDKIKEEAKKVNLKDMYPKGFEKGRCEVFEVWCEDTNKVYFVHAGVKEFLEDPKDDPLGLEEFWPCPMPLLATHTTNSVIPRPDYVMVQDQYDELDCLNDRIATLTKALRVVGAYDTNNSALARMLTGPEFAMIPVDKWAMLAESGGIKGVVDWFPVEQIAKVLDSLVNQRMLVVQQIYELTSIGDIMRGVSNPRDTLGAQKLKAQYSSVRLRLTQQAVAEFVCQGLRIKSEIICKHFDPQIILKKSQIEQTESAPFAQAAVELLKDYDQAQYRIEVTEESLSMADYTAERDMRVAALTAIGQFLSQSAQIATAMPSALPYIIRMIQWMMSSFRGADDVETLLDEASKLPPPQPPQEQQKPEAPDPNVVEEAKARGTIAVDNNQLKNDITRIKAQGVADILSQPDPKPEAK